MLGHGGAQGADAVESHAPQSQHVGVEPVEVGREQRVARRLGDRRVQLAVELDQGLVVARGERAPRALHQRAQRLALVAVRGLGGEARRQPLELDPQLEDLLEVGGVELGHEGAAPREDHDEVLPGESPQGTAPGGEADAELGRPAASLTAEPGGSSSEDDAPPDAGVRDVAERVRRACGAAGARHGPTSGAARARDCCGWQLAAEISQAIAVRAAELDAVKQPSPAARVP